MPQAGFQSTLPVRGATRISAVGDWSIALFQSTLPVRGATAVPRVPQQAASGISIHAPRAGGDSRPHSMVDYIGIFQSTLPVRGATLLTIRDFSIILFQSTLPVRGATPVSRYELSLVQEFQSTLPVRGATVAILYADGVEKISIHAPRAGGDCSWRLSLQRAGISIHAPRAGGDSG